jgi:hypothetical protein
MNGPQDSTAVGASQLHATTRSPSRRGESVARGADTGAAILSSKEVASVKDGQAVTLLYPNAIMHLVGRRVDYSTSFQEFILSCK